MYSYSVMNPVVTITPEKFNKYFGYIYNSSNEQIDVDKNVSGVITDIKSENDETTGENTTEYTIKITSIPEFYINRYVFKSKKSEFQKSDGIMKIYDSDEGITGLPDGVNGGRRRRKTKRAAKSSRTRSSRRRRRSGKRVRKTRR